MRYLPHTPDEIDAMLKVVGAESLDSLFSTIPQDCRRHTDMDLPEPMTEWELMDRLNRMAETMGTRPEYTVYIGAGSYQHYIPSTVTYLQQRSEFSTSYTPYQPEMSQGTLQALYEYQTLVARLLGMEAANASLYDGASALAEALLMAIRITGRRKVAISTLIHPSYRRVVRTYLEPTDYEIVELPRLKNGLTDPSSVSDIEDLAAVAIQSPNFFGCIEEIRDFAEKAHNTSALLVTSFTEALAYGLLKSPGSLGADIVCGEGQSLGIPCSFGGPGLGIFAGKMEHVRNMPGRLVGQTTDIEGKRGFVLTLATREQHIRREKATSNICTNNSLCAITAAMYLASVGGSGMHQLAMLNHDKSEYLKRALRKAGFKVPFESPTFNEFVIVSKAGLEKSYERLLEKKIVAGLPLSPFYPEMAGHYLFCVTEMISREEMDILIGEIES
jgi:glycine dehydrogenase subunit 1